MIMSGPSSIRWAMAHLLASSASWGHTDFPL